MRCQLEQVNGTAISRSVLLIFADWRPWAVTETVSSKVGPPRRYSSEEMYQDGQETRDARRASLSMHHRRHCPVEIIRIGSRLEPYYSIRKVQDPAENVASIEVEHKPSARRVLRNQVGTW